IAHQNRSIRFEHREYETLDGMNGAVDILEMLRVHAREYNPGEVPARILQSTREDDGRGFINPVLNRNRHDQAIAQMIARLLKIVAVRDVDRRRRPGGSGHRKIAVAICYRKIERLRKTIAMLGQRLLKFLKSESGPESGDCFQ